MTRNGTRDMPTALGRYDVLIAGAGVAAATAAVRLLACGFRPLLLRVPGRQFVGVEALPPDVVPQLEVLGCASVLERAGAVACSGFERILAGQPPALIPGQFWHVQRGLLARALLAEAVQRGAQVIDCSRLPRLQSSEDAVRAVVADREETFAAALDATGRSAVWSRPVQRWGRRIADLYQAPGSPRLTPGRIVTTRDGWAYRVGLCEATTVGIVTAGRPATRQLPSAVAAALAIVGAALFRGRRPAFPQWSTAVVQGRRLAVGDAAFACDPVAGQGVRFAVASALAATAVVVTWRHRADQADAAVRFYQDFVATTRDRHLSFLADFYEPSSSVAPHPGAAGEGEEALPGLLCFTGRTCLGELNVEGLVVPGTVIELPAGGRVRWLGPFDLLLLRELAPQPTPVAILSQGLVAAGVPADAVERLLRWCVRHQVLAASRH